MFHDGYPGRSSSGVICGTNFQMCGLDLIIIGKSPSLKSFLEWTEEVIVLRVEVRAVREPPNGIAITVFGTPQPHEREHHHAKLDSMPCQSFFLGSCNGAQYLAALLVVSHAIIRAFGVI
ncbi:hypothetical protein TNCV_2586201 [Trichonephila clavipes]|nr:hypothetical protein TNCV_2586201 [Trichonephila clavipes]